MNAVIPGQSLKTFSRALACLSKIGDDLTIEATKKKLVLSTLNSSRSAFATYSFFPKFFGEYRVETRQNANAGGVANGADGTLICQVLLKTLTTIFRSKSNLDRNVERCELRLEDPANDGGRVGGSIVVGDGSGECRLIIRMVCKYGILKTHKLTYSPAERLSAVYTKVCPHHLVVDPRLVADWTAYFHPKLEEVTLSCGGRAVHIKSFWEDEGGAEGEGGRREDKRSLQTELTLDVSNFSTYLVQRDIELTFNLKEFKAVVSYADGMSLPISVFFENPGGPIIFSVQSADVMLVDFVFATLPESSTSSQPAVSSPPHVARPAQPQQQRTPYVGTTLGTGSPSMGRQNDGVPSRAADDEEEERLERRRRDPAPAKPATVSGQQAEMRINVDDAGRGNHSGEEAGIEFEEGEADAEMVMMLDQPFEMDEEEEDIAPTPPTKEAHTLFTPSQQ